MNGGSGPLVRDHLLGTRGQAQEQAYEQAAGDYGGRTMRDGHGRSLRGAARRHPPPPVPKADPIASPGPFTRVSRRPQVA